MPKNLVLLLVLIIGGISLVQGVFAQGRSLGISPLSFELTGNPGEVIENYLRVFNPSKDDVVGVKMEVEDIAPSGETGGVVVEAPGTETYSLASWVRCEPGDFSLNPKEEKFIKFTITVPQNAEPGGHYGSVLAGSKAVTGPEFTGTAITQRVGSLVLLTVPGEMREKLLVEEFAAPNYSEYGPIPFTIKFKNKGTVHVRPIGSVTITDFRGEKITEIEIPQKNVLPEAIRKIEVEWCKKWLFGGKYTATLTGSYGISDTPFPSKVINFWVFPWKLDLGIVGLVILMILGRRRWMAALQRLVY